MRMPGSPFLLLFCCSRLKTQIWVVLQEFASGQTQSAKTFVPLLVFLAHTMGAVVLLHFALPIAPCNCSAKQLQHVHCCKPMTAFG